MNNISAVIAAKQSPPYLSEVISSISSLVAEIIILDIGLDQNIVSQLKEKDNVKLVRIEQPVPYIELIREQSKQYAAHEYIMFLDPDEIVSPELSELLAQIYQSHDFISIPRKNMIMQKWIKHSRWWPDRQVRLFKKTSVIWPTHIHQQPQTTGNGYIVEAKEELALIHQSYDTFDDYITKAIRYAKAEAQELVHASTPYYLKTTIRRALSEFISRYFADDGYKDGMHGFVLAFMQMFYYFLVYFYYWDAKKYPQVPVEDIARETRHFFAQGLYETNHWSVKRKTSVSAKSISLKFQNLLLRMTK
jgi:(heptosyl)LPS beta-1,4-glucosyltransferase